MCSSMWFLTKKPHISGLSISPFFILFFEWKIKKFLSEYFFTNILAVATYMLIGQSFTKKR